MEVLKFGFQYWKCNLGLAILSVLMSFAGLAADLMLPMITALFINHVIKQEPVDEDNIFSFMLSGKYGEVHTLELFWHLAVLFVALLLFKEILVYAKGVLNQTLGLRLETDMRLDTFHKLMELDSDTISKYNTGELLTILNSDTIMFKELFCRIIPNILDSIFVLVTAVVLLASINPWLLLIPLVLSPFFAVALLQFRKRAKVNFQRIRGCNSTMNLNVQENIEAVRLVRSFTNEDREKEKFDASNQNLKEAYINQVKLSSSFEAVFSIIKQTAYVGSIAVCAGLVMSGQLLVGYLVTCTDYVSRIMNYITTINNSMFQMQQQVVSGHKMMDFMACESKIQDGKEKLQGCKSNTQTPTAETGDTDSNQKLYYSGQMLQEESENTEDTILQGNEPEKKGELEKANSKNGNKKLRDNCQMNLVPVNLRFSHASMVLDGVQVLHDINIDIPQGKKVGVVGGTGSGKSLLLESLIRVHDMTSGEITLNGKDIREYELESLRDHFAYVFQDVFLFSNTIDSNIAYSDPDIEQEQVVEAAKHAQAHGFIQRLQDGYHTIVGERGIGISGGQKQRVSIARALLKDAPVLVLDDSTSALDVDTERQLLADIKNCYPEKTLLITAHRLSSVVDCDEILYMQDGRVIERGTFEELMRLNGHFASVYNIQQVQQSTIVDFDALAENKENENKEKDKENEIIIRKNELDNSYTGTAEVEAESDMKSESDMISRAGGEA